MNKDIALFRKNNFGEPCFWQIEINGSKLMISHGILGKKETIMQVSCTMKTIAKELTSRIDAKRKEGYKYLTEIKDDGSKDLPDLTSLTKYLRVYLPVERTQADGKVLAMLATSFNNDNDKLFKKGQEYIGQYKINGLRCFISAVPSTDLFYDYHLEFQSREGEKWNLTYLEQELLDIIPRNFLDKMVEEHYILDGEVYIPGAPVNIINHAVKDPTSTEHKALQYWCYDLAVSDYIQHARLDILHNWFNDKCIVFNSKEEHLNNKNKFVLLPNETCDNEDDAVEFRNRYIDLGFEGLIMRNINSEYAFGSRSVKNMIKYKKATDGIFEVIDIVSEGGKRPDIPVLICKNDINDVTFEIHIGGTLEYQRIVLVEKHKYIGKSVFVEFGERSGVNQVPFHVKTTRFVK